MLKGAFVPFGDLYQHAMFPTIMLPSTTMSINRTAKYGAPVFLGLHATQGTQVYKGSQLIFSLSMRSITITPTLFALATSSPSSP